MPLLFSYFFFIETHLRNGPYFIFSERNDMIVKRSLFTVLYLITQTMILSRASWHRRCVPHLCHVFSDCCLSTLKTKSQPIRTYLMLNNKISSAILNQWDFTVSGARCNAIITETKRQAKYLNVTNLKLKECFWIIACVNSKIKSSLKFVKPNKNVLTDTKLLQNLWIYINVCFWRRQNYSLW